MTRVKSMLAAFSASMSLAVASGAWAQDGGVDAAAEAAVADAGVPDSSVVAPIPTPLPPGIDASPPEPPTPMLGDEVRFDLAGPVKLVVIPPFGWAGEPSADVNIEELTQMPGAESLVEHSWSSTNPKRAESTEMFVVCAAGPASDWAPGMESLVFERLNAIANAELAKRMAVSTFSPGQIEESTPVFRQSFEATGKAGGDRKEGSVRVLEVDRLDSRRAAVVARGRHVIGFLPDPERVVVCSAACVEPVRHSRGACSASIASFRLDGPLAAEPSPSWTGRFVLGIKRRPTSLLGTALGLLLALAGILAILRGLMIRSSRPV